jgi:protocatechuate 3,4-dioxygenase, alpha subunit
VSVDSVPADSVPADSPPGGEALATPSQTIGPFFRFGMDWFVVPDLVAPGTPGAVTIAGRVLDGAGEPVPDAAIEIWQADAQGHLADLGEWHGWGRSLTDDAGGWQFTTVKPGRVDEVQAPHIDVTLFARGLLQRLVTRIYFPDEGAANDTDPVLLAAGTRASTLVAAADGEGRLHHDLVLQGDDETVFLVW